MGGAFQVTLEMPPKSDTARKCRELEGTVVQDGRVIRVVEHGGSDWCLLCPAGATAQDIRKFVAGHREDLAGLKRLDMEHARQAEVAEAGQDDYDFSDEEFD